MDRKYHPVIEYPHTYTVSDFSYHNDLEDYRNSYIDLILVKGNIKRRLRFLEPKELSIEVGFPNPTGGMYIEDVSGQYLERINVRVGDFEASRGEVVFWAYKVIDLDE